MRTFAAVLLSSLVASSAAVAAENISVTQSAAGYVADTKLVVECAINFNAGRQVQSLLWTPSLPAGWSLDATTGAVTGHGKPQVDPDGISVIFLASELSDNNPLIFRYTVNVPAGEAGERELNGILEYQLDGMSNPADISPSEALMLKDADANHDALGYLAGTPMTVTCTFSRPEGVALHSLLWRPVLPATDWELVSASAVSPGFSPEVDPDGEAIVFLGDITANPITFTYTVQVPAEVAGEQTLRGEVEYQLAGMVNPATTWAEPDPLILKPLHTFEISSPYGTAEPAVGLYTNFYGTELENSVNATETVDAYTHACAGWLLEGLSPSSGTGNTCDFTLTNNAKLAWVWVAPAVGNRTVNERETLSFQAEVAYTDTEFEPLDLVYSLDAASVTTGMTISDAGVFSWIPSEEQGGADYTVTITVTDNGAAPHWLTATETFTIEGVEVNHPPALDAIPDQLADEHSTLTFTARASDSDLPKQTLTFSLDQESVNAGMTIDPSSGEFSWSPTSGQAAATPYTVTVTVTDDGQNPPALSDSKSFTINVVDSRATHESFGYLTGRTAEIVCAFEHPADKTLLSLLWRPILPAGWGLISTSGQASPEIDFSDGTIVFTGYSTLNDPNPLTFSYIVSVPDGLTGPQEIRAEADYLLYGMVNPLTIRVNPDPLPLTELHTYEIVSVVEGQSDPAVGVYTNVHGTALSATVDTPLTVGTRTFASTGWTLAETNQAPADGSSTEVAWTLNHDAILTWHWVAPLIDPSGSVGVTMSEDNDPTPWEQPALSASEPYRPELESQLAWSLLTGPIGGTATVTGTGTTPTIDYKPAQDWYGSDSFVVRVIDGLGGFDQVAVNVTVEPVNDPPVLAPIGPQQTDIFTPLSFTAVATDVDLPAQTLTFSISGAPDNATFDSETGEFSWVPEVGQAGTEGVVYTVTITVTDDGSAPANLSASETFTLTLMPGRATHSTIGYIPGELLAVDGQFAYPNGRDLQSLLWRPELPEGWTLESAAGEGNPSVDPDGEAIILLASSLNSNPISFTYYVQVPEDATGTNAISGFVEYQLDGMANPGEVRAQPDPLIVPMRLLLADLNAADKVYDGLTNAVVTYGSLSGGMPEHDVSLDVSDAWAYFDTPDVGATKQVTVGGLALSGEHASWYAIDTHVVTAAVTQATLTVTADAKTKTYGDANPTLTLQYDGFVNEEDTAVLDTLPTATTQLTAASPVGVYDDAITVSGGDDGNYAFVYKSAPFEITKASANVSVTPYHVTYNGQEHTATGTALGVNDEVLAGLDLSATTHTAAGTYTGDVWTFTDTTGNYADASGTIDNTIDKAGATIDIVPFSGVYDGDAHGLSGTVMSADGVTDLSSLLDFGETFTAVPGGTATWSFAGDDNHNSATGTKTVTITKKAASVTPDAASKTYGAEDPALTGTLAGFLSADNVTASYSRTSGETAGETYEITAALTPEAVLENYEITYNTATFSISKKSVTVTAEAQSKVYDGSVFAVGDYSVTYSGFVNNEDADALGGTLAFTGAAIDAVNVGKYAITPAGLTSDNYAITFVDGELAITQATLTVTPTEDQNKIYGAADPVFGYVNTGTVDGETAGFAGALSRETGETVGTYAILVGDLALANNDAFLAANYELSFTADMTFEVQAKIASMLTISDMDPVTYNGEAQAPVPTIYDGDTLLTKGTDYTLSYANNTDAGTATLTVTGIGNYDDTANKNFTITRAELTITADDRVKDQGEAIAFLGTEFSTSGLVDGDSVDSVTLFSDGVAPEADFGTYAIVVSDAQGGGLSNYTISYLNGTLTVATVRNMTRNKGYSDIQTALAGANTNDVIVVSAGIYHENPVVTTPVTLLGADNGEVIIDGGGSGSVVSVFADNTRVSGFTVQGSGGTAVDAGIMLYQVSGCALSANTSTNNANGVAMVDAADNVVSNNVVCGNTQYGIAMVAATGNTLAQNLLKDNILDAIALDNADAIGGGGVEDGSTGNLISGNFISGARDGIFFGGNCNDNQITDGNMIANVRYGVNLWLSDEQTIIGNDIVSTERGIWLFGSSGNTIAGNNITNNYKGIQINAGLDDIDVVQSANNVISGNNISANAYFGMQSGVRQSAQVNALSNWWGAVDGPSGAGQGSGGAVAETVLFTPWYTDASMSNLVPYNLYVYPASIGEHAPFGSEIGEFIVTDEPGDTHQFRLVSGDGTNDADNACFTVNGAFLLTAIELDYETKNSYQIFAEVDDGRGGVNWMAIVINIEDENDAPEAADIHLIAVAGHSLAFDPVAHCSDADGDPLTVHVPGSPAELDDERGDGLLAFTGLESQINTTVRFNYVVSDGELCAQAQIEVEVVGSIEEYLNRTMAISYIEPTLSYEFCKLRFPAIWTDAGGVNYSIMRRPDLVTGGWSEVSGAELTFSATADGFYGEMHVEVPITEAAPRMFYKVRATVTGP